MLEPPLWQQANKYSARLDRQFIEDIFDIEGVIKPTGGALLVTPRAAGANMSIDIAAGRAVIKGDDEANQGSYRVISTAVENRPVGAPPGSDSRIDLVVARVRDANVTGGVSSDWVIEIIPGAVAPTPVAPAVPATAIPLAQILVAAGTLSIDGPKITDRRTAAGNAAYGHEFGAVNVDANETTTSTVYTDLASAGPALTVTVPASGRVLVVLTAGLYNTTVDAYSYMGFAVTGAHSIAAQDARSLYLQATVGGREVAVSRVVPLTGITPGSCTFTTKYRAGSGTAGFKFRGLTVITFGA